MKWVAPTAHSASKAEVPQWSPSALPGTPPAQLIPWGGGNPLYSPTPPHNEAQMPLYMYIFTNVLIYIYMHLFFRHHPWTWSTSQVATVLFDKCSSSSCIYVLNFQLHKWLCFWLHVCRHLKLRHPRVWSKINDTTYQAPSWHMHAQSKSMSLIFGWICDMTYMFYGF